MTCRTLGECCKTPKIQNRRIAMYSICCVSPLCLSTNNWLIFEWRGFYTEILVESCVFHTPGYFYCVWYISHGTEVVRMMIFSKLLLRILTWRHLTQARIRGYLCSARTENCIILLERWILAGAMVQSDSAHVQRSPSISTYFLELCTAVLSPPQHPERGLLTPGPCSYLPHWRFKWGNCHYVVEFRAVFSKSCDTISGMISSQNAVALLFSPLREVSPNVCMMWGLTGRTWPEFFPVRTWSFFVNNSSP